MQFSVFCLCLCILATSALPYNPYYGRLTRTPYQHRAMMVTGYYGNPYRRAAYEPESTMTAYASGDTLATNQFPMSQYDPQEPLALDIPLEENAVKTEEQAEPALRPQSQPEEGVEFAAPTTSNPRRVPKKKQQKPQAPVEDDAEDDEVQQDYNPFSQGGRRQQPSNVYFPIVFGGYGGGRSRNSEEGPFPGSATAIANSFSTGKGGVASSHATAYGDPYSSMFRGANGKRRYPQQQQD